MHFAGRQCAARLPQLTLQRAGGYGIKPSLQAQRVAALYNVLQSQLSTLSGLQDTLLPCTTRRSYADRPVGRPKAHTGRTTAARKKAPTTSKTQAAKKPAAKKSTPKARPKATQKAKPKAKPKPKPAKPRTKRKLTEAEQKAATIKTLKAQALAPPHGVPSSAWSVFLAEHVRAAPRETRSELGPISKEASAAYKNLEPERLEVR